MVDWAIWGTYIAMTLLTINFGLIALKNGWDAGVAMTISGFIFLLRSDVRWWYVAMDHTDLGSVEAWLTNRTLIAWTNGLVILSMALFVYELYRVSQGTGLIQGPFLLRRWLAPKD